MQSYCFRSNSIILVTNNVLCSLSNLRERYPWRSQQKKWVADRTDGLHDRSEREDTFSLKRWQYHSQRINDSLSPQLLLFWGSKWKVTRRKRRKAGTDMWFSWINSDMRNHQSIKIWPVAESSNTKWAGNSAFTSPCWVGDNSRDSLLNM